MRIVPAQLADSVARLVGTVLYVDTDSTAEEQLAAIADAAGLLLTGRSAHGHKVRHLRAVTP